MPEIKPTETVMWVAEDGEGEFHYGFTEAGQVTTTGLEGLKSDPDPAVMMQELEVYADVLPAEADEDQTDAEGDDEPKRASNLSIGKDGKIVLRRGADKIRHKIKKKKAELKALRDALKQKRAANKAAREAAKAQRQQAREAAKAAKAAEREAAKAAKAAEREAAKAAKAAERAAKKAKRQAA